MKNKNVIEINGKLYDARTGELVVSSKLKAVTTHKSVSQKPKTIAHKSIDGFSKNKSSSSISAKTTLPKPATTLTKKAPRGTISTQKASLKARRSVTLHRSAVAAPKILPSSESKNNQKNIESSALKHINPHRLNRAQKAEKSPAITRFGTVIAQPTQSPAGTTTPEPASSQLTQHLKTTHAASNSSSKTSVKEALIKSAVHSATHAAAHAKPLNKPKRSLSKFVPAALATLLISGYVAYLNVPSISMKVAAHRAGFAASLPSYKPAGYSLSGPIATSPGEVSVNFASNTDDRNFKLKQQPTTWDSTALLENFVVKKSPNYLTYQDRGLTIYIFDGSSAAWVNGGKLYQIEGSNSRLDTDQLLKLATSV